MDSPGIITGYPTDLITFIKLELDRMKRFSISGPLEIYVGSQELEHKYIIQLVTLLNENKAYGRIGIVIVKDNGDVEIL